MDVSYNACCILMTGTKLIGINLQGESGGGVTQEDLRTFYSHSENISWKEDLWIKGGDRRLPPQATSSVAASRALCCGDAGVRSMLWGDLTLPGQHCCDVKDAFATAGLQIWGLVQHPFTNLLTCTYNFKFSKILYDGLECPFVESTLEHFHSLPLQLSPVFLKVLPSHAYCTAKIILTYFFVLHGI